ncbi:HAD family hydrolase [Polaribacter sp.]|uniref:HAD family hydrolase n=1 Tax=Polaribacter sp. TaxID=1920175 RepID=UPI003F6C76CB
MFKGVIFDLDGTLVNSLGDITNAINTVLKKHNFPTISVQECKSFIGHGVRDLVVKALPKENQNEEWINRCFEEMLAVYRDNCTIKTAMYPDISNLLDELTARNLKLAVFSNKADELTKKVVKAIFSKWNFEVVEGLKLEALKKPNPTVALEISEKLAIPAEQLIFVGDTDVDIITAKKANMHPVGVVWGYRTKEELISSGAKFILENPLDLIKIL